MKVKDLDIQESDIDKSIESLKLDKIDEKSIYLSVYFRYPNVISSDLLEPDALEITFLQPDAIIDA